MEKPLYFRRFAGTTVDNQADRFISYYNERSLRNQLISYEVIMKRLSEHLLNFNYKRGSLTDRNESSPRNVKTLSLYYTE